MQSSKQQPLSCKCTIVRLLQFCHYFHGKYLNEPHYLVPTVQTFTAGSCYGSSMELNHSHFFHITNVKRKFLSASPQELLLCGKNSFMKTLLNTHSLCQRSILIYPPHPHSFYFLQHPSLIHHNHFNSYLVVIEPYIN